MLASMTSREFVTWQVYADLEPFGEIRSDLRTGIECATLANIWRSKTSKAYKPVDFMPKFGEDATPQKTWQEIKALAIAALGGKNVRKVSRAEWEKMKAERQAARARDEKPPPLPTAPRRKRPRVQQLLDE